MTDAVAYYRCSSLTNVDGDTWDRQCAAVQHYAHDNNIQIVEEFRDEGVSGRTELQDRAGLAACMARVENNGVKLVLVESADRLARDLLVNELILREFHKAGAKVITASGIELTIGEDQNPTARLVRQILAAISEFDRSVIVLKLRAARERQRAKGERCEGRKPYGTKDEVERLRLAKMMHLASEGKTAVDICRFMNSWEMFTRSGKPWHYRTVAKILKRHKRAA